MKPLTFKAPIRSVMGGQCDELPAISVVVPLFNELEVLPQLLDRLRKVLASTGLSHEIVMVDDGSVDGSGEYLLEIASHSIDVRLLRMSRNFGKEAALSAGLGQAAGDAVIVIDADLQDPPELIPRMISAWRDGADVVCMKRRCREGESRFKKLSAHVFYRLLSRLSAVAIPEDTGDFRLMSRQVVDAINQLPERNRYMKGLFAWVGFPPVVLEYDRPARAAGLTKWNMLDLAGLAIEGVTSFSTAPLRWMIGVGAVSAAAGGLFGVWIILKTLMLGNPVAGYPSLLATLIFFAGVQLMSLGIVGQYVGKTYIESKQRPLYVLRNSTAASNHVPQARSMQSANAAVAVSQKRPDHVSVV